MQVEAIPALSDNYIWAITDESKKQFACVDPGEALPVLEFAQTKQHMLAGILITHHHQDHIGGVLDLLRAFPSCPVYGPDDPRIPHLTQIVRAEEIISLIDYHFKVIFNPGHTATHISYYEPKQEWLFCGDTLFSAGCGRVFDGTLEQLYQSIQLLASLPPATKVFCAHEYTQKNLQFAQKVEPDNSFIEVYLKSIQENTNHCTLPSTIELEQKINPFFRVNQTSVIRYAEQNGVSSLEPLEIFRLLRLQKNNF